MQAEHYRNNKSIRDCDRGQVGAAIFDQFGMGLAGGKNELPVAFSPCSCNDGADTNVKGSKTCKAVHAEVTALGLLGNSAAQAYVIAVTRPPCKRCIEELLMTDIQLIVTTDEYPDRDKVREVWEHAGRRWKLLPVTLVKANLG